MKRRFGWRLVGWTALIIGGAVVAILAVRGITDDGLSLALRSTARTSLALFLCAFTASSIHQLWGGRVGKWLRRNRRYVGVSFAASHAIHLGLIAARAAVHPDAFWANRDAGSLAPGAIAYAFIAAMTLTSFDRTTRWLGRRRWKVLHKTGVYVIWGVFVGAYAGRLEDHPADIAPFALLLCAVGLRLAARARTFWR